jgi:hypothetical protein
MGRQGHRYVVGIALPAVCALFAVSAAAASAVAQAPPHAVSSNDPLAACNPVNDVVGTRSYEHQASLEVDPKDSRHLVAVWTQDFDDGTVLATSHDGGATWTATGVPGQTPGCGGDQEDPNYDSAQNPRAAVGPDGAVYVVSNINSSKTHAMAVRVNATRDDGVTWSGSETLEFGPASSLDWVWVTADPTWPGVAAVLWDHRDIDANGVMTGAFERVARTTSWGGEWSAVTAPPLPPEGSTHQIGQLHTLPDHTLIDVFAQCRPETSPLWVQAPEGQCVDASPIRVSHYDGTEWSDPLVGPEVGPWFDARITNRGELLVASVVADAVMLRRSPDLGVTWDPVRVVRGDGVNLDAAVTETATGTIAVGYYHSVDANDTTATFELATSRAGAPWVADVLDGPFDALGPQVGHRMGEWVGLRAIGSTIDAVYARGPSTAGPLSPSDVDGPMDVFLATRATK